MPGMEVPEPGGTMKKMSFEFTDPAQAAAGPVVPAGAGVPPAGAQGAMPPAGMQAPMQPPEQAAPQEQAGSVFGAMAGNADTFGQGPDSSMFTDDQLAAMVQDEPINPIDLEASMMEEQLPNDPQLQMQMMQAARRMGGF